MNGFLALRRGLRFLGLLLRWTLQLVLALLILFEEWGWRPLADALGYIARWRPIARLETAIAGLPPYVALVVFLLPSTILLPLKFLALVLITRGYYLTSVVLFLLAKAVATALVARLFILTQPALMSIGWFAWGYDRVMPWKDALTEKVRSSFVWRTGRVFKWQARRAVHPYWMALKPRIQALAAEAVDVSRTAMRRIASALRGTGTRKP